MVKRRLIIAAFLVAVTSVGVLAWVLLQGSTPNPVTGPSADIVDLADTEGANAFPRPSEKTGTAEPLEYVPAESTSAAGAKDVTEHASPPNAPEGKAQEEPFPWYSPINIGALPPLEPSATGRERPTASYWPNYSDAQLLDLVTRRQGPQDRSGHPDGTALFIIKVKAVGYDAVAAAPVVEVRDMEMGMAWQASGEVQFERLERLTFAQTYVLIPYRPGTTLLIRAELGQGRGAVLVRPGFFHQGGGVSGSPTGFVKRTIYAPNRATYALNVLCFDPNSSQHAGAVRVRDMDGNSVANAMVVRDGQILGQTDTSGYAAVYELPNPWGDASSKFPSDRYTIWRQGYTPVFLGKKIFTEQPTVDVAFARREVYVTGNLDNDLPNAQEMRLERRTVVFSELGAVLSIGFAAPDWEFTSFHQALGHGPLGSYYFPKPLHLVNEDLPEDVRKKLQELRENESDERRERRRRADEYNREQYEANRPALKDASGQDDPNWSEYSVWYSHVWRLEGSRFSAVLPFPGRFLIVLGRKDQQVIGTSAHHDLVTLFADVDATEAGEVGLTFRTPPKKD